MSTVMAYAFLPTYLYRTYNAAGSLLYIGISDDPEKRFRYGHKVHALWFADVAGLTLDRHESREAAELAETQAIQDERPPWNVAGSADWMLVVNMKRQHAGGKRQAAPGQWDAVCSLIRRELEIVNEPARFAVIAREAREEAERFRQNLDQARELIRTGKITTISLDRFEVGHGERIAAAERRAAEADAACLRAEQAVSSRSTAGTC